MDSSVKLPKRRPRSKLSIFYFVPQQTIMKGIAQACSASSLVTTIIILCYLLSGPSLNAQQVRINEVVADNTRHLDEDGDSPDWLELRNFGESDVSLGGWQLTDNLASADYWTFPDMLLSPDAHLQIWASGKDRSSPETARTFITQGDQFRYLIPTQNLPGSWKTNTYDDSSWASGSSGFGYNDGDDNTQVPGGTTSVFLRRSFTVTDPTQVEQLLFDVDYDDGFVAYINGIEIARFNLTGSNPSFNATTPIDREAEIYRGGLPERFVVSNPEDLLQAGENMLAIQVHNVSSTSSDLSLIPFLSAIFSGPTADGNTPAVLLPIPGGALHTDFRIGAAGETLYLLDPAGEIVDSLNTGILPTNVSIGIPFSAAEEYAYYNTPSPGAPNLGASFTGLLTDTIHFSHQGGITTPLSLSLSGAPAGASIRFTVDASEPLPSSPVYTNPIPITETTVVRARLFRNSYRPSSIASRTYLLEDDHELPVISLVTAPANLFDEDTGIYAFGDDYNDDIPHFGANFWEDWERPVHISLYEPTGELGFELNAGIKIFGGWSRSFPQRSFSLFARKRYGPGSLDYPLFPDLPYTQYQAFILRNSGTDFLNTNLRDVTLTSLMRGAGLEIQANRPAATYINGEYWGFYNLREKVNEHFIAAKFDLDPDDINIVELDGLAIHGDNSPYLDLMQFVSINNLSIDANYRHVAEQIDIENYIIYNVAQIYFNNNDWPGNNIKYWQPTGGKWRWILFDTDFGFGIWNSADYFSNTLAFALETNGPGWPNPPWSTLLFRKLMANQDFRHQFINRYADELNSRFLPQRVRTHIDTTAQRITPEIARHYSRWESSSGSWWGQVNNMRNFGNQRPAQAKEHILTTLNVADYHQLTIRITDTDEGFVRINNRLTIEEDGWTGDYFEGVPFAVEAFARPGYVFSHWESSQGNLSDRQINVNIRSTMTLRPVYTVNTLAEMPIVINEINYNSASSFDTGDWIELYNPNNYSVDISGWVFKDDDDTHEFIIPDESIMAEKSYWILARDKNRFQNIYPALNQVVGNFSFGLSSNGDAVRLFNQEGELQDEVYYGSEAPWPVAANGDGPTLELIWPDLDNNLTASWASTDNAHGSPGALNFPTTSTTEPAVSKLTFYPNPGSDVLNFQFQLAEAGKVKATLYDAQGRALLTLFNQDFSAGPQTFTANVQQLPSGTYFLELRAGNSRVSGRRWVKL